MGQILSYPANTAPSSTFSFLGADPAAPTVTNIVSIATLGGSFIPVLSPSGDTTGVKDTAALKAAITALPATGGSVWLNTGEFYITGGSVIVARSGVYVRGMGKWATVVYTVGSGDTIYMYDSSNYYDRTVDGGGVIGVTFDGANTTGDACGLHAGDIWNFQVDVGARNYTAGTTSKGLWFQNQYYWMEQMTGILYAENCSPRHVVFDSGSFDRPSLVINGYFADRSAKTGTGYAVSLVNGAQIGGGEVSIHGNMNTAATQYAVLEIAGETGSGTYSTWQRGTLNIDVELDDTNNTAPYTIYYGTPSDTGNTTYNLVCNFDFALNAAFTPSNIDNCGSFIGQILGDANLEAYFNFYNFSPVYLQKALYIGAYNSAQAVTADGQTITTTALALVPVTTTAAYTGLIMETGGYDGQVITVINQGTAALTFAAAGTSHVALGTNDSLAASGTSGCSGMYVWSGNESLWYRMR